MTDLTAPLQKTSAPDQIRRPLQRLREKLRRRRDAAVLAKLDDHMLRDIGLTRYDIEMLAKS